MSQSTLNTIPLYSSFVCLFYVSVKDIVMVPPLPSVPHVHNFGFVAVLTWAPSSSGKVNRPGRSYETKIKRIILAGKHYDRTTRPVVVHNTTVVVNVAISLYHILDTVRLHLSSYLFILCLIIRTKYPLNQPSSCRDGASYTIHSAASMACHAVCPVHDTPPRHIIRH